MVDSPHHNPWKPIDVFYYLLMGLILLVFVDALGSVISPILHDKISQETFAANQGYIAIGLYLLQCVLFFLPVLIIARRKENIQWVQALGLRVVSPLTLFLAPLIAQCTAIVLLGTLEFSKSFQGYDKIPGLSGEQESLLDFFGSGNLAIVFAFISIVIIAPLIEEMIFRGFVQQAIQSKYSEITSIVLSAGIFASIHMEFDVVLPLFLLGIVLGTVFSRTKSIVPCILFHVLNNGIVFFVQVFSLAN